MLLKLILECKYATVILIDEVDAALDTHMREILFAVEEKIIEMNPEAIIIKISHNCEKLYGIYNRVIKLQSIMENK